MANVLRASYVISASFALLLCQGAACGEGSVQPGVERSPTLAEEYQEYIVHMNQAAEEELRLPTREEIDELGKLWPSIPPEQNAAFEYAQAFAQLVYMDEYPPGSRRGARKFDGDAEPLRAFVAKQKGAIEHARKAASFERCQFPPLVASSGDRNAGFKAHLKHSRHLATVISDAGLVAEVEGKYDEAAMLYLLCVEMRRHMHGPGWIEFIVGQSLAEEGYIALERLMANEELAVNTLEMIIDRSRECDVSEAELRMTARRAFDVDRWTFGNLSWEEMTKQSSKFFDAWPTSAQEYYSELSKFYENVARVVEQPLWVSLSTEYDLESKLLAGIANPTFSADDMQLSAFRRILGGELGGMTARLRGLQIRAALQLYAREHGAAPETLDQLAKETGIEVPIDPFSSKPMRYRRVDDSWRLWSVGTDLADDGGELKYPYMWPFETNEIVFPAQTKTAVEARSRW